MISFHLYQRFLCEDIFIEQFYSLLGLLFEILGQVRAEQGRANSRAEQGRRRVGVGLIGLGVGWEWG